MREPDATGRTGKAWQMSKRVDGPKDWEASIASWVVEANGFHPLWNRWVVSAIHLRPIEGVKPASLQFETATHEFVIAAIDPESEFDVDRPPFMFLMPLDLTHQVGGIDDAQAARIVSLMVRTILDGNMSPDQDFRSLWESLLDNTARHMAEGKHELQ